MRLALRCKYVTYIVTNTGVTAKNTQDQYWIISGSALHDGLVDEKHWYSQGKCRHYYKALNGFFSLDLLGKNAKSFVVLFLLSKVVQPCIKAWKPIPKSFPSDVFCTGEYPIHIVIMWLVLWIYRISCKAVISETLH